MGFPDSSLVKNRPANTGDVGLISELGKYPGEGNDNLLQYSCLEISWTEEPGGATIHGIVKEMDKT